MENMVKDKGSYIPRQIIASTEIGAIPKGVKLKKGQGELLAGTVLGVITSTGLSVPVDSSARDGSENPSTVLTDTVNTDKAEDPIHTGYVSGVFKADMLVFGGSDTLVNHEVALKKLGIYVK